MTDDDRRTSVAGQPSSRWRRAGTLIDLVADRARDEPGAITYTFLADGEVTGPALEWSNADLLGRASAVAGYLQSAGLAGGRALLLYAPGLDYIAGLYGAMLAGSVAVPAYPPGSGPAERALTRLQALCADAAPTVVLTTSDFAGLRDHAAALAPALGAVPWVATDDIPAELAASWRRPSVLADSVALLQYTSGSTGQPKGVLLTHANLLHNCALIRERFDVAPGSSGVIWLPPYHDMGLIGGVIQPLYSAIPVVLMSPLAMLQRPMRWAEAVCAFGATISGGPNFSYDLMLRKSTPAERARLDLSAWRIAFNGADVVRIETMHRFAEAFGPAGFTLRSFVPCYGLAEATLIVTATLADAGPAARLAADGTAAVGCGTAVGDQAVMVLRPDGCTPCQPGEVGEIAICGPSVARGYAGQPAATAAAFTPHPGGAGERLLRTGDLGLIDSDGALIVRGRRDGLIIVGGRNYYPQDLESSSAAAHPMARPGGCAAFTVQPGTQLAGGLAPGPEAMVCVVQELAGPPGEQAAQVALAIRQAILADHGVAVGLVALALPRSVPKTSSGKVRRSACSAELSAGTLALAWTGRYGGEADSQDGGAACADQLPADQLPADDLKREVTDVIRAQALRLTGQPIGDADSLVADLGLDSLAAVDLAWALEQRFGASPPLDLLLGGGTIADLAGYLREHGTGQSSWSPPEHRESTGIIAMSEGQAAIGFLHELMPDSLAYHVPFAVRIRAVIEPSRMCAAFGQVLARHELLRARVGQQAGLPVLRVRDRVDDACTVLDVGQLGPPAQADELRRQATIPFDLLAGPLVRLTLLRVADDHWIMLVLAHHIVIDLSSMVTVLDELVNEYATPGSATATNSMPEQPSYADFVRWQSEWLSGPRADAALDYFRAQLADAPARLDLPADRSADQQADAPARLDLPADQLADRPTGAAAADPGCHLPVPLDPATIDVVRQLASDVGVTTVAVLLALWAAFLARHSGQDKIVVCVPASSRPGRRFARVVGYFVNPLPVMVDLAADPTLLDAAATAAAALGGALRHRHYPFPRLIRTLGGAHARGYRPLMQALLVVDRAPRQPATADRLLGLLAGAGPGTVEVAGLDLEPVQVGLADAQADLCLRVADTAAGLNASLTYDGDLFDHSTAGRLAERLAVFVASAVRRPRLPLSAAELVGPAERTLIMAAGATSQEAATAAVPGPVTVTEMIMDQAVRFPAAVAITCGDTAISYRELATRAALLAGRLRSAGVARGDLVGLCLERTPDLVTSMLGILITGGCYVPLDPAYPADRLRYMLAHSQAGFLISEPDLAGPLLADAANPPVLLRPDAGPGDSERPGHAAAAALGMPPGGSADGMPSSQPDGEPGSPAGGDLAYVMYTSGSTGRPKGVAVTHRSVAQLARWAGQALPSEDLDGVLAITSVCFDISVFEILVTLALGGRIVLSAGPHAVLAGGAELDGVRLVNTSPTVMTELLADRHLPRAARTVVLCGEPLRGDVAQAAYAAPAVRRVYNLYGPTEDTVYSTVALVDPASCADPPIGRPIAGTHALVLDHRLSLAPIGVAGDLYLGGAGLARGYHRDARQTAERFVPDPHGPPGGRLYRTGDVARLRADGELEFLGRADRQVKIRGVRIEPGEIEAALRTHPMVRDAIVTVSGPDGRKVLTGYVAAADRTVSESELTAFLRGRALAAMVPARIVVLPALPRLPNGKIDVASLPAPGPLAASSQQASDQLAGPTQTADADMASRIAGIWAQALDRPDVDAGDDFFALGGHSLVAARIVARMREAFGVTVQLREFFQGRITPASLAASLLGSSSAPGSAGIAGCRPGADLPVRPADRSAPLPLSSGQQRLWFLQEIEPATTDYIVPALFEVHGEIDGQALRRSIGALVARHEILRTTYLADENGRPRQVIHPTVSVALPVTDLSALPPERARLRAGTLSSGLFTEPFNLAAGPMLRAALFTLAPGEHLLAIALHHIACDGQTLRQFGAELTGLYASFASGRQPAPPPGQLQYADFAAWQQQMLSTAAAEEQLRQCCGLLANLTPLPLANGAVQSAQAVVPAQAGQPRAVLRVTAAPAVATGLRRYASAHSTTPFVVLLALFAAALRQLTGARDVPIATPADIRTHPEFERTAGFFVNTVVVRCPPPDCLPGCSPADHDQGDHGHLAIERVKDSFLAALEHREVPFDRVIRALRAQGQHDPGSLADIMLVLQQQYPDLRADGVRLRTVLAEPVAAKTDLTLVIDADAGFRLTFEYRPHRVAEPLVRELAGLMTDLMQGLGAARQAAPPSTDQLQSNTREDHASVG